MNIVRAMLVVFIFGISPKVSLANNIPYPEIDTTSQNYYEFLDFVNRALDGRPKYGFRGYDAILAYVATVDSNYAELAISWVDDFIKSEEDRIASGLKPKVAADSYLYSGPIIRDVATVYDWAGDKLSDQQKIRWSKYASQAIFNIWHPKEAEWGGISMPWSGWSTNNPGNNYHYSFLEATIYWAIASDDPELYAFLENEKWPKVVEYFRYMEGGGSREGTGYGVALRHLFSLYELWQRKTGENLARKSSHVCDTIEYIVHATLPTFDRIAPIGDQARDSTAKLYDYHRSLVSIATYLCKGTTAAKHGMWWLTNAPGIRHGFNLRDNLFKLSDEPLKPTETLYMALGTGDLFVRSSWDSDAVWFHTKAGFFDESHAHEDQGGFSLFYKGWLAVTENINTKSGIRQDATHNNVVRFIKDGELIHMARSTGIAASMQYNDDGNLVTIHMDLSNMYLNTDDVNTWKRDIIFNRNAMTVDIHDVVDVNDGIRAIWQLNTPYPPTIFGSEVVAGPVTIRSEESFAQISTVEWNRINPREYQSGWRVDIENVGVNKEFNTLITVNPDYVESTVSDPGNQVQSAMETDSRTQDTGADSTTVTGGIKNTVNKKSTTRSKSKGKVKKQKARTRPNSKSIEKRKKRRSTGMETIGGGGGGPQQGLGN